MNSCYWGQEDVVLKRLGLRARDLADMLPLSLGDFYFKTEYKNRLGDPMIQSRFSFI
jgi:hypothetical protein